MLYNIFDDFEPPSNKFLATPLIYAPDLFKVCSLNIPNHF